MFSSLSTCPLAHSPEDALLPYASLLVLFFLLSIPASVPTPYRLPSTSQFLAISLTQDQHFFGCLSRDVFELSLYHLFSFPIFFLIFIKAVSPAIQSCSLSSLSLSFISRGRKEVSAGFCPAWHGQGWASLSSSLASWNLSSSGQWDMLWHPTNTCVPHSAVQGGAELCVVDGTSTEEAEAGLVMAGTFCCSTLFPKQGSHSTLLGMLCTSQDINRIVINSSAASTTFQCIPTCMKFWLVVHIWQSGMGLWCVVKCNLFDLLIAVDNPGWVVRKCDDLF